MNIRCDASRIHICTSSGSNYTHLTHLYLFEWMNEIKPTREAKKNPWIKVNSKKMTTTTKTRIHTCTNRYPSKTKLTQTHECWPQWTPASAAAFDIIFWHFSPLTKAKRIKVINVNCCWPKLLYANIFGHTENKQMMK